MPEHVHLLILPHEGTRISQILQTIKQPVAQRARIWLRRHRTALHASLCSVAPDGNVRFRFWQPGGGYDRNLWSRREIWRKVHYIHANPVRRGLVARPEEWPWSSWRAWHEGLNEPIRIDRHSLPPA